MLVLSRKNGQEVVIGDNIKVTVLDAVRGKVKLGIDAPREIPVHRDEVLAAIAEERRAAAGP